MFAIIHQIISENSVSIVCGLMALAISVWSWWIHPNTQNTPERLIAEFKRLEQIFSWGNQPSEEVFGMWLNQISNREEWTWEPPVTQSLIERRNALMGAMKASGWQQSTIDHFSANFMKITVEDIRPVTRR